MGGKREEQRKLKMCILSKIKEQKDVLFGPFSTKVTKDIRSNAWRNIGAYAQSLGIIKENKNWAYVRDVWWANVRKLSVEKRDNAKKTGSGGGPDCKENEIDVLVYDILGKESPVLEGLGVDEHLQIELNLDSEQKIQETLQETVDNTFETLNNSELKQNNNNILKRDWKGREGINENKDLLQKKMKLTLDILEKENILKDLQIKNVERDNYLKDLKILDLELRYGLPRSKFTSNLEQFTLAVFIPESTSDNQNNTDTAYTDQE